MGLGARRDSLLGWRGHAGSGVWKSNASPVTASRLLVLSGVSPRHRLCMAGVREALRLIGVSGKSHSQAK